MQEALYSYLESLIGRYKHRKYHIDRRIPLTILVIVILRRVVWLVRGLMKTTFLQFRPAAIFIAPDVEFRNASMCHFGKGVTLERGAIIDGLALRGITLGSGVTIGAYSLIRSSSAMHIGEGMSIGRNSSCGAYSFFGAGGFIEIGENVIMGEHVSFHAETHNHNRCDIPIREQGVTAKPIRIEDDCWIGANVTFLGGSYVSRGSIVGAGAVVNKQYAPFSVIAGVPARVLRSRLPDEPDSLNSHGEMETRET